MTAADKVQEWHSRKTGPLTPNGYISLADAAIEALEAELAEAQAARERAERMLEMMLDDLSESVLGPMDDASRAAILADLAAREEEK